jgi:hypothetical protein
MIDFKAAFVSRKVVSGKSFSKLSCVCLPLEKLVNGKHFPVKEKFAWFLKKCFPFILGGKHFPEIVKKLEISYYLLIISNLVLLIDLYILF